MGFVRLDEDGIRVRIAVDSGSGVPRSASGGLRLRSKTGVWKGLRRLNGGLPEALSGLVMAL
jgi:hypothetical protein